MISTAEIMSALNRWERQPFCYGVADCCRFAIFMVRELTGKDYTDSFDWNDEAEARKIIDQHGGLFNVVCSVLGEPSKSENGSPCLVKLPTLEPLLGIKIDDVVVCLSGNGLTQVPSQYVIAGWHCG